MSVQHREPTGGGGADCVAIDAYTPSCAAVSAWGRHVARRTGAEAVSDLPRGLPRPGVLDLVTKRQVTWLVTELRWRRHAATGRSRMDEDVGLLVRRAPCPVLTVQPWAEEPDPHPSLAVVGVDGSAVARAAARAAARVLVAAESAAMLVLVHGAETHPAELAAGARWRALVDGMRVERHAWLRDLAEELRSPALQVRIVSRLAWAPDLIADVARSGEADLVALGANGRPERHASRLGAVHRRVVRTTPCPMLTVNASAAGAFETAR